MDTTVLIADDHAILREGIRMVLDAQPGITVVGEAEDGRQAVEMAERLHPQIVVMDIAMPNLNGGEATRQIRRRVPGTRVIILTMHEDRQYLAQIVDAGALGAVVKRAAGTELVEAIRAAAQGRSFFSPSIARMMEDDYRFEQARAGQDEAEHLTAREREILQLAAEGKTNKEMAEILDVSIKTVQTHRANLMDKLGAHDRTDLVRYAIQHGIISPQ